MLDADPGVDADVVRLAHRIRQWREEAGLSLAALAERSGVSRSTIHKVETLQMVPSISVLIKIARGLERSPAELVADTTAPERVALVTATARPRLGSVRTIAVERVSGDLADPELEAWRVTLAPGREPLSYDGEELVLCEDGELVVSVDGTEHRLGPGDAVHLKADLPHGWRNAGRRPARFLVVGTVSVALRAALQRRVGPGRGGR
ncbi:MAG: hypothetical protein C4321_04900 [Chloroflexota bacterium]